MAFLRLRMVIMAFIGLYWPLYGVSLCDGLLWQNTDLDGFVLSFFAVIDPNSSGLVLCALLVNCEFTLNFDKEKQKVHIS